jgi:hypothetical protein
MMERYKSAGRLVTGEKFAAAIEVVTGFTS